MLYWYALLAFHAIQHITQCTFFQTVFRPFSAHQFPWELSEKRSQCFRPFSDQAFKCNQHLPHQYCSLLCIPLCLTDTPAFPVLSRRAETTCSGPSPDQFTIAETSEAACVLQCTAEPSPYVASAINFADGTCSCFLFCTSTLPDVGGPTLTLLNSLSFIVDSNGRILSLIHMHADR